MIHSTAIVHPGAKLAADVQVGAYAIIDEHVQIGAGTSIGTRAVITGHTRLGRGNTVHQFATLGTPPQSKGYRGEPTRLEIGDENTIGEYCSLNLATAHAGGVTRMGDHNRMMSYSHVGHDCQVGNHVLLANGAQVGGHVVIGDHVLIEEGTLVHQFARIGELARITRGSAVQRDVPPYVTCGGNFAKPQGVNDEALARHGFSAAEIEQIRWAYEVLYLSQRTLAAARTAIAERGESAPHIRILAEFLASSVRGIIR